jgi:hypothetical protein
MPPSLFRRLHSRAFRLGIEIFGFLHVVLVMAIEIIDYYFCAEDCCDSEVTLACAFLCGDALPLLLLIACGPAYLVRSMLLYAYVPWDPLGLAGL